MKKLSIILTSFLVLFIGIYLTSCATIATGTSQLVTITCNVDGADIKLDGISIAKHLLWAKLKKMVKFLQ